MLTLYLEVPMILICHTFMVLAHLMLPYEQSAAVNWDDSHEGLLGIGLPYSSGDKNEEI